jgi:hypothetical protein
MYILTLKGRETDGAYSVIDEQGEKVLYLFVDEDDATRFAIMLEEDDYPEMSVIELDDELVINMCETEGYRYTIITQNDIVVPPKDNDYFS